LPAKKPADYSGAVGKFTITAKVSNTKIATSQQGELLVTISGKGNFIQLGPPHIGWPREFEVFDPEVNDHLNKNITPVEGHREYVYHFTLGKEGSYTVPSIRFTFFDPASDSFSTLHTDSMHINAVKGDKQLLPDVEEITVKRSARWWLFLLLLLPAAFFLWMRRNRTKKPKIETPPPPKPVSYTERLIAIDVSVLPDKEACRQLQKILAEVEKKYPEMEHGQKEELKSICEACQLLAYSSAEEEGRKEELKRRSVRLLLEIEK
jgi:hypothetical protein